MAGDYIVSPNTHQSTPLPLCLHCFGLDLTSLPPGDYKYGWHAMHRAYDPAELSSDDHGRKIVVTSCKLSHEHPHHSSSERRRGARLLGEQVLARKCAF